MSNGNMSIVSRQYKTESADIVIVGNGIAGLTAAVEARRLSPDARIAIITEQIHPTINTPALKQFAIGKLTQEQLLAYPAGTERAQRIHVVNARVEGINAQSKYVSLNGGYGFGYGSLLLATGSVSNGLPDDLPGRDFDGVLTLHCLQDYLNLRRRLNEVNSAVVVGGGAHAIETVMGLLHYGIEVHWLIRGETLLAKMLDRYASELVLENVRSAGAKVYTNTELVGMVGRVGSVAGVVTTRHNLIPCQLVLQCTGTRPVTTLAETCDVPILHDRGILVDDQFRTNVRDIYAAGDVAARKNPQTGIYETHAQWYDAVLQGRTVAAAMTGHHELASRSLGVNWHATHLGSFFMLTVGDPLQKIEGATILTDSAKKRYRRVSLIDDQLVGYLSLGSTQPDSLAIKRIIDEGLSIHGVKKALLKGDFDARKYFSQSRSRAARALLTSDRLPVVNPLPITDPLARAYPRRIVITGALAPLPHTQPDNAQSPPARMSPGYALPSLQYTRPGTTLPSLPCVKPDTSLRIGSPRTEPLEEAAHASSSVYNQLTIHEWSEEAVPSIDKPPVNETKVVESMLVALPSRPASRNLWSYSEKMPAVTLPHSSPEHPRTTKKGKKHQDKPGDHTNFLL